MHPRQLIFLRKSNCLGCAVLLCLVVCLTLLASFFLPSTSLIKTCIMLLTVAIYSCKMDQVEPWFQAFHAIYTCVLDAICLNFSSISKTCVHVVEKAKN